MKKLFFILLVLPLVLGGGCSKNNEPPTIPTTEGYRKVVITGTVTTKYGGDLQGTSGFVNCLASGTYEINLWFSEAGGQALKQENELVIADVICPAFGSAQACSVTLPGAAHQVRSFDVVAKLYPDAAKGLDASGKVETVADQIDVTAQPSATPPTIEMTKTCGSQTSTTSDYGMSYNQILLPFMDTWNTTTYIGEPEQAPSVFENKELPGGYLSDVTMTVKEEWVSSL
jgi:hypothetical protein